MKKNIYLISICLGIISCCFFWLYKFYNVESKTSISDEKAISYGFKNAKEHDILLDKTEWDKNPSYMFDKVEEKFKNPTKENDFPIIVSFISLKSIKNHDQRIQSIALIKKYYHSLSGNYSNMIKAVFSAYAYYERNIIDDLTKDIDPSISNMAKIALKESDEIKQKNTLKK
jgi:hypothetical protein